MLLGQRLCLEGRLTIPDSEQSPWLIPKPLGCSCLALDCRRLTVWAAEEGWDCAQIEGAEEGERTSRPRGRQQGRTGAPTPALLLLCRACVGALGQLSWLLWLQEVINLLRTAF